MPQGSHGVSSSSICGCPNRRLATRLTKRACATFSRGGVRQFPPRPEARRRPTRGPMRGVARAVPPIVSSVMGLYPPEFVARLKARKITWFANVSTVAEAMAAEAAGADVIVAQGMEAGGHRGSLRRRRGGGGDSSG